MVNDSKLTFQITIPRRAAECAHGHEAILPGTKYYSILIEGSEKEPYERRDYCPACWHHISQGNTPINALSAWKSKVPEKKGVSALPKQRDARALHLLKEAVTRDDSVAHGEAFVLALYLARRRRIFLRQELKHNETGSVNLYEAAETE